jgi:hypothetical protein
MATAWQNRLGETQMPRLRGQWQWRRQERRRQLKWTINISKPAKMTDVRLGGLSAQTLEVLIHQKTFVWVLAAFMLSLSILIWI